MINVEPDENIQDKIDEELAEMEADGSDSEGRSTGATPNSIISITDEETILDGETIDLTADDASTIVIESRLRLVILDVFNNFLTISLQQGGHLQSSQNPAR